MQNEQLGDPLDFLKEQKNNFNVPYYARAVTIHRFPTDMGEFPYRRFYRQDRHVPYPVIFDREPGVAKRAFLPLYPIEPVAGVQRGLSSYTFQRAASTVVPPRLVGGQGCVHVSL